MDEAIKRECALLPTDSTSCSKRECKYAERRVHARMGAIEEDVEDGDIGFSDEDFVGQYQAGMKRKKTAE